MTRAVAVLGLLTLIGIPANAPAQQSAGRAAEIASCVARNVPRGDELRSVTLITTDRTGAERTTRADVFGRRSSEGRRRTLVSFRAPEELEGSGLLVLESRSGNEMWVHTPELGKRKLGGKGEQGQSLFGTGLSYEDFVLLLGFVRTEATRLEVLQDEKIGDRDVYVLRSTPRPGTSSYQRIETRVDQRSCLPLRAELFQPGDGEPRRVLETDPDHVFPVGKIWVAHAAVLHDRRDERQTVLHVESVIPDLKLPDEAFRSEDFGKYRPKVKLDVKFEPVAIKPELAPLE